MDKLLGILKSDLIRCEKQRADNYAELDKLCMDSEDLQPKMVVLRQLSYYTGKIEVLKWCIGDIERMIGERPEMAKLEGQT